MKGNTKMCSLLFLFAFYLFIHFWLCWVFAAERRLCLVAAPQELLSGWVRGLLTAVAPPAEEHGLSAAARPQLGHVGSLALPPGSGALAPELQHMGLVAQQHVGSSQVRD